MSENKNTPELGSDVAIQPETSISKLLEFQKRVNSIPKDSTNPFFKSKYFDVNTVIEVIRPILNDIGLVVTQGFDHSNGHNLLVTKVMDGNTCIAISEMLIPDQSDVQKLGAAITYCRRYALVSLLLLQGEEDDDGNKARPKTPTPSVKQKSDITAPKEIKEVSDANKAKPITEKQNKMIHALMKQKGVMTLGEIGIEKIEHPTMADASMIIKKLMDYKVGDNVIQLEPTSEDIP